MDINQKKRQHWMGMLAQASPQELEQAYQNLSVEPECEWLRQAESGLTLVRARTGGTGQRFNMGEMTMSRASVVINNVTGHGYVKGRNKRHAELAAIFDALLQQSTYQNLLMQSLIDPIAGRLQTVRKKQQQQVKKTQVEFFTMVRGESD